MSGSDRPLTEGEPILLYRKGERSIPLSLVAGKRVVQGFGVVDLTPAIGLREGDTLTVAGTSYTLLRPSLRDLIATWPRATQIVTPKDAGYLLYLANVSPGSVVIETGTGSGALTLFLARAVGADGRVITYDRRPEHQKVARERLAFAGVAGRVTFREGDAAAGFQESAVDAVVLDVPEPWALLPAVVQALRTGGSLVTYTPTYNQLERTVRAIREGPFGEVTALELIERPLHVGEGGTRPSFEMLGHTGFLAGARKVASAP